MAAEPSVQHDGRFSDRAAALRRIDMAYAEAKANKLPVRVCRRIEHPRTTEPSARGAQPS
jgi:hypothetical protein